MTELSHSWHHRSWVDGAPATGYRAPRNAVVVTTLVAASFLIAGSIYLILDMDYPLAGTIRVSPDPLLRAEAVLRR